MRRFVMAVCIGVAWYATLLGSAAAVPLSGELVSELSRDVVFSRIKNIKSPLDRLVDRVIKLALLRVRDPAFMHFLGGDLSKRGHLKIRLEKITWGGVKVDDIPLLDDPSLISAAEAGSDLVFGVRSTVTRGPISCASWAGPLFETTIPGRDKPLVFGSSGFLYRSNKMMFERETNSLWNQFTGKPVSGSLAQSLIALKVPPVFIMSWVDWKKRHPNTDVLSL